MSLSTDAAPKGPEFEPHGAPAMWEKPDKQERIESSSLNIAM